MQSLERIEDFEGVFRINSNAVVGYCESQLAVRAAYGNGNVGRALAAIFYGRSRSDFGTTDEIAGVRAHYGQGVAGDDRLTFINRQLEILDYGFQDRV